jgi:hypothetical protein
MSVPKTDALPLGYARLSIGLLNHRHVVIITYLQNLDKIPNYFKIYIFQKSLLLTSPL